MGLGRRAALPVTVLVGVLGQGAIGVPERSGPGLRGAQEAEVVAVVVDPQSRQPMVVLTHDLMLTLLGDLRASVRRIVITDLKDDVYYARLDLDVQGRSALAVDARPSDAIALALRAKAPILVEEWVFDQAERLAPRPGAPPPF